VFVIVHLSQFSGGDYIYRLIQLVDPMTIFKLLACGEDVARKAQAEEEEHKSKNSQK
jgi:hypothetical protein